MSGKADIWNRFEKTDPAHTKQFNRGGFKGTALNGTYIVKKLTAEFGPCGKGWRFVMEEERIEEGHALKSGDKTKVHIIRGHIEYKLDGEWYSTSPQFGQTMLVDENKNGTFTDEEAPKKSITDCISKCAVLLGIGADIHLGMFDDHKYVNQRKAEEAEAQANNNGHANGNGHAISEEQVATIFGLIKTVKADTDKFCAHFKIPSVPDLPVKDYTRAVEMLNMRGAKPANAADYRV